MYNTIYAFAALLIAMTISVTMQQAMHAVRARRIKSELFVIATGLANTQLEMMSNLPFDSLGVLDGRAENVQLGFDADTLAFTVEAHVAYVEKSPGGFEETAAETELREITLRVVGEWDINLEVSRIFNRITG
jgi:hypothetical protein